MAKAATSFVTSPMNLSTSWRTPLLNTTLQVTTVLGSLWFSLVLYGNPTFRFSVRSFIAESVLALMWAALIFRRWPEAVRLSVLLSCFFGVATLNIVNQGPVAQAVLVPLALSILLTTLYWGLRGGLIATAAVMILYVVSAYGWLTGIFPLSSITLRSDPHELFVWVRLGLGQLVASSAIVAIVYYVMTHAQQTMNAVRDSQEKFSKAFHASPDAITITEADTGRFVDVNQGFERLMGYSNNEMRGRTSLDIGLWVDPTQRTWMMEQLRRAGTMRDYQVDVRNSAGEHLIALFNGDLIELNGKPHLLAVIHDVTARIRAEQSLRASEESARLLIEHAPEAIVVLDVETQLFVAANPAAELMFGLSQAELLNKSPVDLSPERQPGGRISREVAMAHVMAAVQGTTTTFEWVHRNAQGRDFLCEVRLLRLPDPSRILVRGSVLDISERKHMERALRALSSYTASITGQAFFAASVEELVRELGVRCAFIAELREQNSEQQLSILALWAGSLRAPVNYATAGTAAAASLNVESLHVASHVSDRYPQDELLAELKAESYLGVPIRDTAGNTLGVVAVINDRAMPDSTAATLLLATTASRAAAELVRLRGEAEILRLNAELERRVEERTAQLTAANAELESFSYSVSHDLRSPLRAIEGFSHALEEDCGEQLDARARTHLGRMRNATSRMAQLIDDMLRLSRTGRAAMNRDSLDMAELAREVIAELAEREVGRDIKFICPRVLRIRADRELTRIILTNLLDNAWKYTRGKAHARVELNKLPTLDDQGATIYFVRDNGAGFDMQYAGKLFSPFQRMHRQTEFEGSGIGLATVQRIAARHGGKVWAESKLNEGTTVYFTMSGISS